MWWRPFPLLPQRRRDLSYGEKLKGMDRESKRCGNLLHPVKNWHLLTSSRRRDAVL